MDILRDCARELGIDLTETQAERFQKYWELLSESNKCMNLTAVTGREEVFLRHFIDSLALVKAGSFSGARVIDVGSGAGFPGLPIAIAFEDTDMTLLDSQMKRVDFLQNTCLTIGVNANCLHGRAEELGKESDYREGFDFALSRAVARLDILTELCLPLVRVGGRFLAMKADISGDELDSAVPAIAALGGVLLPLIKYTPPGSDALRTIVAIEKASPTPDKYPRRFAKIQKSPIS